MIDDLQQAAHDTVQNFKNNDHRGAVALAPQVGMNPTTLSNKVNPNLETHHLNLLESIPLQVVAQDFRILRAYARELNHLAIPLIDFNTISDAALMEIYARFHKELGEMAGSISQALEDGKIEPREVRNIKRESFEAMTVLFELINRLEGLAHD